MDRATQKKALLLLIGGGLLSSLGVSVAAQGDPVTPPRLRHEAPLPPLPLAAPDTELAPPGTVVEMALDYQPGNDLEAFLSSAGVSALEAASAAKLIRSAGPILSPTELQLSLGDRQTTGHRTLVQLRLRPNIETILNVQRRATGPLSLTVKRLTVDATPLRFRGTAGTNLYWSLRSAGAPAKAAADYLTVLRSRSIGPGDVRPSDRFDLILDNRRVENGESEPRELLYAGLLRATGDDVTLLRWSQDERAGWVDPGSIDGTAPALPLPVSGRITSAFGSRAHPIFGFRRFHRGIDIGAAWGTPIHASADGMVTHAGWNGGYGIQVRLAHGSARATSYSHMSKATAVPGRPVRRGQVIGYVGSSGFSTGAHLHFETLIGGQPVNPLGQRFAPAPLAPADRAALALRLRQLLSVPNA